MKVVYRNRTKTFTSATVVIIVMVMVLVLGGVSWLAHVDPWSGSVGSSRDGVVDSNPSTVNL